MAIQRAQAQTSTTAKLAPPYAAAHKLRHYLLNFRACPSFASRTPLFSIHHYFNTDFAPGIGALVGRLRDLMRYPSPTLHVFTKRSFLCFGMLLAMTYSDVKCCPLLLHSGFQPSWHAYWHGPTGTDRSVFDTRGLLMKWELSPRLKLI